MTTPVIPVANDPDSLLIRELSNKLSQATIDSEKLDAYYNGAVRLATMGLALPPEMSRLQVVVNWPRLVVDSLEERLDIEGFRRAGSEKADDELWQWWQANNLDEESSLAHLEAFVHGRGYITVGFPDKGSDIPVITVESARCMFADVDPRTRKVRAAIRHISNPNTGDLISVTVYLPDRTVFYENERGQWREVERRVHNLGVVPVVPLVNRARVIDRYGRSEMHDIMPLTDAACRSLTNLQGAQELLAVPQRYVLGAREGDFVDPKTGKQKTTWQVYLGRFLALTDSDSKIGQLPGADLQNFNTVINLYAQLVSSLSGLPPHFLGQTTVNPASADAIRSAEARLIKRAERKIRAFSGPWETVMRIAMRIANRDDAAATRLEAIWADPATPTYAAKADAVSKLFGQGAIPIEELWEQLGYSTTKQARLAELMTGSDPMGRYVEALRATQPAESVPA